MAINDELYKKVIYLILCNKNINEICNELNLTKKEVLSVVRTISESGTPITVKDGEILTFSFPKWIRSQYNIRNTKDHIKIGLLGDTHLANKYDDIELLNRIYDKAEDEGVDMMLHAGDMVDGIVSTPKKDYFELLKETTYKGQLRYAIDKYPKYSGKTYVVSGNHDDYWTLLTGKQIINDISKARDDIVYLGPNKRIVNIGNLKVNVLHGRFGRGVPVQNVKDYVDNIPTDKLPDFIHTGHTHVSNYAVYNGVELFRTSSLIKDNPYIRARGLHQENVIFWLDVYFDDNGNVDRIENKKERYRLKK